MPGPFSLHLGQKGRYPFAWEAPQLEALLRSLGPPLRPTQARMTPRIRTKIVARTRAHVELPKQAENDSGLNRIAHKMINATNLQRNVTGYKIGWQASQSKNGTHEAHALDLRVDTRPTRARGRARTNLTLHCAQLRDMPYLLQYCPAPVCYPCKLL